MAKKKKEIHVRVRFEGEREASDVFMRLLADKIRHTKTKDNLAKRQI